MSNRTINLNDTVYQYLLDHSVRESDLLKQLREETSTLEMSVMQISPEQGQFMALLVELLGAKRIIEVGTFTGYSALCMAQAMPEDGELICCDISKEWTDIGKPYWQKAGVDNQIKLQLSPAIETLDQLISQGESRKFDMAFIDADKTNYLHYFESCLELLRPGGLIMFDNTLWDGDVADPTKQDEDTQALRALNDKLHTDDRVSISMLPVGDGLTLARKK